jgi:hypothetical protein
MPTLTSVFKWRAGVKTLLNRIRMHNEKLAAWGTKAFGTMFVFWLCFFYGLLPLIPGLKSHEADLLYWSNWVQLWALPLLMVGNIVLSREASQRAKADHQALMEILHDIRSITRETR